MRIAADESGPARCGNTGEPSTTPAISKSKEYVASSVGTQSAADPPLRPPAAQRAERRSRVAGGSAVSREARMQAASLCQQDALRSIGRAFSEMGRMLWHLDVDFDQGSRALVGLAGRLRDAIDSAVEREIRTGQEPGGWAWSDRERSRRDTSAEPVTGPSTPLHES